MQKFKSEWLTVIYEMFIFAFSVSEQVRYVDRVLYNFKTYAYDIANNSGSVTTIVEIEDIPSEDPIWVTPFATHRLLEKTTAVSWLRSIS